uniref:Spermatogenesis associated 7 n=2 Tax=Esox lucius TaxID=8010 RepID=A0A3P8XQH6_ESOLU
MVSHYKKVYSAKAAIDASVPKSMLSSVKYNDQLQRERLRKDASRSERHPQSHPEKSSRAYTRASCPSQNAHSRAGEESTYFDLGSSLISSQRLHTTFQAKQIVYQSQPNGGSRSPSHFLHAASEYSYGSPDCQRQQSSRSCATTGTQGGYKAFQDPVQKTYSGDLIQKHAHRFTQDKPFTPRTLKSDSRSYLSRYRYYTPPRRKPAEDVGRSSLGLTRRETYQGSTQTKDCSSAEWDDPPQRHGTEHEWLDTEDESHALHLSASGRPHKGNNSSSSDLFQSSYRVSPDGMKSPTMKRVSVEEEELLYLEFIADVTNEILSRGLFSDRILERVFERHIDKNKHRLCEDKMRHLLETLHNDMQSPANTPAFSAEPVNGEGTEVDLLHSNLQGLDCLDRGALSETKENNYFFPYSLIKKENDVPLSVTKLLHGSQPESTDSISLPAGSPDDKESAMGHNNNRENVSPSLNENTPLTPEDGHHREIEPIEDSHGGMLVELEDLEKNLSKSLHVSYAPDFPELGVSDNINEAASFSDDEF